jgi:nitrite reductase/ring-hydroxylating ferredoxin subunit
MENAAKPDFGNGFSSQPTPDFGMVQGQASGEDVVLALRGDEFFAMGASCSHYGGSLVNGLIVGEEVRCPLHHACFDLRTGEALRAPAFLVRRALPRRDLIDGAALLSKRGRRTITPRIQTTSPLQ